METLVWSVAGLPVTQRDSHVIWRLGKLKSGITVSVLRCGSCSAGVHRRPRDESLTDTRCRCYYCGDRYSTGVQTRENISLAAPLLSERENVLRVLNHEENMKQRKQRLSAVRVNPLTPSDKTKTKQPVLANCDNSFKRP